MCTSGFLQTCKTNDHARFNLHMPNPSPHPTYNVENMYLNFFLTFNIVLGGGGGNCYRVIYSNAFQSNAQINDNDEFA